MHNVAHSKPASGPRRAVWPILQGPSRTPQPGDYYPTVPATCWGVVKALTSMLFHCRLRQFDMLEPARMLLAAASGLGHAAEPAFAESSGSKRPI